MMGWFENFTQELQSNEKRNKVKKPHVFRRFVKALQTDFEPELTELQNYIQQHELAKGLLDFSNFHTYNRYMALKMKKRDKLKNNEIPKIDLDDSRDSSIDSDYSNDADH